MPRCRPDAQSAHKKRRAKSDKGNLAVPALPLSRMRQLFLDVGWTSFLRGGQGISGLADRGTGIRGAVPGPIHRKHERMRHGRPANVVNVRKELPL